MSVSISFINSQSCRSALISSGSFQLQAAAPSATNTSTETSAQALYSATQQLWVSMEVLGHMLISKQTGPNLEIAYTLFAKAVCNWESTYNSFTSSGGQPDAATTAINTALNQTLPDGSSIYKLSQTVASNPSDWQQLQAGVSNSTLNSLFKDVDNWIDMDGAAGSKGFQPSITSSDGNLEEWIYWLNYYLNPQPPASLNYYDVFCSIANLDTALQGRTGPICNCLNELFNTPFFEYDGKSYSLEDLAAYVENDPSGFEYTPTQIQEGEAALNSCLSVLKEVVNIANGYLNSQV